MGEVKWNQEEIKEASRDFNAWQGRAVIKADSSDGSVWTDVFPSNTEWKEYHSESIFTLYEKDNFRGRDEKISADTIRELLEQ